MSDILSSSTVRPDHAFEAENSNADESSQTYFLRYFSESRDPSAEFFSLSPALASGEVLASIRCFRNKQNIYAIAESGMSRTVLEELIRMSKKIGGFVLYIVVLRELPNFLNTFKMLAYAGFKQVLPRDQKELCTAQAVLVEMKINRQV